MRTFLWIAAVMSAIILSSCGTSRSAGLDKSSVDFTRQTIVEQWKDSVRKAARAEWLAEKIVVDDHTMPFWKVVYGNAPADGRSLYISLHGGGNTAPEFNDGQWNNQKFLYRPAEGVYVAPRAPVDDWDMWCKPFMDKFYSRLIEMCVAYLGVNPDKVYLLGYSAGGDGVWRMAPRMADSWAASSMMAGHPGDVSLVNLRNTPFMIWCGGNDAAYDRNKLDRERGFEMDSLQNADPEGYIHETHILEGKGHWMDHADTVAVEWMSRYTRDPYPHTIVWQQEEVLRPDFYWLSAPQNELKRGMTVRLKCEGNVINISRCDYSNLRLWLDDAIVDLDKPVTVVVDGNTVYNGRVRRSADTMRESLKRRSDPSYSFPAYVDINVR